MKTLAQRKAEALQGISNPLDALLQGDVKLRDVPMTKSEFAALLEKPLTLTTEKVVVEEITTVVTKITTTTEVVTLSLAERVKARIKAREKDVNWRRVAKQKRTPEGVHSLEDAPLTQKELDAIPKGVCRICGDPRCTIGPFR